MGITLGWIANLLLIWSWYALGNQKRYALLLGAVGSFIWAYEGWAMGRLDLIVIEVILGSLGIRAWRRWCHVSTDH